MPLAEHQGRIGTTIEDKRWLGEARDGRTHVAGAKLTEAELNFRKLTLSRTPLECAVRLEQALLLFGCGWDSIRPSVVFRANAGV